MSLPNYTGSGKGFLQSQQLRLPLYEPIRLPRKPYATDDLAHGLRILPLAQALKLRYIQPNPPSQRFWLVFDIDREGAAYAWEDADVAPPNFAVISPESRRAHLWYGIDVPIITSIDAREAPLRYAAAIERAYMERLQADIGYAGLIAKNPVHPTWITLPLCEWAYDLDGLADYIGPDLGKYKDKRRRNDYGIGRNVTIFNRLRQWAYKNITLYRPHDYAGWYKAVRARAEELNDFPAPLPESEIRATTKSVAKWTWKHFRPDPNFKYTLQAERALKRAEKASANTKQLLIEALKGTF